MDKQTIETCQKFLTVDHGDREHKLVDLDMILVRHTPGNVVVFLQKLISDYDRHLRRHILRDKTDPRLDQIVSRRFRVRMALNTLRNAMAREAA